MDSVQGHHLLGEHVGGFTPNFSNFGFDSEETDLSFADDCQISLGNYDGLTQNLAMEKNDDSHNWHDYFSVRPAEQLGAQQGPQSTPSQDPNNDDIGNILTPGLSILNINVETGIENTFPAPIPNLASCLPPSVQGIQPYSASPILIQDRLEALPNDERSFDLNQCINTAFLENNIETQLAVQHGQLIPSDIQQKDDPSGRQKKPGKSLRGRGALMASKLQDPSINDDPSLQPAKRRRKSKKKKPLTKEQEAAKREIFLERNRAAANKCRQNRRKWISNLEEKCLSLSVENAAKKAALQKMEQELVQLKSMMLMHLHSCKFENILAQMKRDPDNLRELPTAA